MARVSRLHTPLLLVLLAVLAVGVMAEASETKVYPKHEAYWTGRVRARNHRYHKMNNEMLFGRFPPDTNWHSYAKFDLSTVPNLSIVKKATMYYRVVQVTNPCPPTHITVLTADPTPARAEDVYFDIQTGTVAADTMSHGTGWVGRELDADGLAAIQAGLLVDWVAFGIHAIAHTDTRGNADGALNWTYRPYLVLEYDSPAERPDIGAVAILSPTGSAIPGAELVPTGVVSNNGQVDVPFRVWFMLQDPERELYREYVNVSGLSPDAEARVHFPTYLVNGTNGEWIARCSVAVANDVNPDNDIAVEAFVVSEQQNPQLRYGWQERTSLPMHPNIKGVKKGGWMAFNRGDGYLYAAKGNKTSDFYCYSPLTNDWRLLAPMPYQTHPRWARKAPSKGARAVSDKRDYLYVLQGNNTLGFWRYSISRDEWEILPDVIWGNSNKKIKGGTDMVYVEADGVGYIYILKGYKQDFCRYNVASRTWESLPDAPAGRRGKWGKGSWLVFDGDHTIYAHKAKYHELWAFDLITREWSPNQLPGMPWYNSNMRKKLSKDGGSADWYEGAIYALKGGNTGEFWVYDVASGRWTELDAMPKEGNSGLIKAVRKGGDFAAYAVGRQFFAFKGNGTFEFWRYRMAPDGQTQSTPDVIHGGAASAGEASVARMTVSPSIVTRTAALVRYLLPRGNRARILVEDILGRVVAEWEIRGDRGTQEIDTKALSAGVYLVRLETGESRTTRKLVIQR